MSTAKIRQFIFLQVIAAIVITAVSCNSKETDDESEIAVTPALVAVKNFYLQANDSVMKNLDSVFFSIDLKTGVIFNADSLPKGINVKRLVPSITFANNMSKAELSFLKDNKTDTVTDFLANPGDSIDFTHPVKLEVTAADGVNTFTYTIKVNVHEQMPDTLIWNNFASSELPSRLPDPVSQKTLIKDGITYCLVEENDDTFTLSTCTDLFEGEWQKEIFDPGFYVDTQSFTATDDTFFLLDIYGELFKSENLEDWTDTEEKWISILGPYSNSILGVKIVGEKYLHARYPAPEGYVPAEVDNGFPIAHSSELGIIESTWAPKPMAILACGMTKGRSISSAVWAFDGDNWAVINSSSLPKLESPMMVRYVVYRDTPYVFTKREFDVWLLVGGVDFEGEMNRKVYMSYDNGVNWSLAPESMQLSDVVPDVMGANLLVAGYELSADLSDYWTVEQSTKTRGAYTIEGWEISWMCPYLYLFGGHLPDNRLNTVIWRGVLERLRFTPII